MLVEISQMSTMSLHIFNSFLTAQDRHLKLVLWKRALFHNRGTEPARRQFKPRPRIYPQTKKSESLASPSSIVCCYCFNQSTVSTYSGLNVAVCERKECFARTQTFNVGTCVMFRTGNMGLERGPSGTNAAAKILTI